MFILFDHDSLHFCQNLAQICDFSFHIRRIIHGRFAHRKFLVREVTATIHFPTTVLSFVFRVSLDTNPLFTPASANLLACTSSSSMRFGSPPSTNSMPRGLKDPETSSRQIFSDFFGFGCVCIGN